MSSIVAQQAVSEIRAVIGEYRAGTLQASRKQHLGVDEYGIAPEHELVDRIERALRPQPQGPLVDDVLDDVHADWASLETGLALLCDRIEGGRPFDLPDFRSRFNTQLTELLETAKKTLAD